jgi:hypothetical protein
LGQASAALGVVGVVGYGLLSAGAARAYGAVGIEPREVGLSSGAVLAQTTISIGVVVAIMLAPIVVPRFRRRLRPQHFAVLAGANLALTAFLVVLVSSQARRDFRAGHRTAPLLGWLALPSPWQARIATLAWTAPPPGLGSPPSCALYLGTSDGVIVIHDHERGRTIRVPEAQIIVSIAPDLDHCEHRMPSRVRDDHIRPRSTGRDWP